MPDQEPTSNVADEVPRSDSMTEYDDGLAANDWLRLGEIHHQSWTVGRHAAQRAG